MESQSGDSRIDFKVVAEMMDSISCLKNKKLTDSSGATQ
jgi:hypothetical protein